MAVESAKDSGDSWPRQEEIELDIAPEPGNIVLLYNLVEIHELWRKDAKTVYRATRHGHLHAYGRPGHQKYYSAVELTRCFGEPLRGPNRPARTEKNDKGGYAEQLELETVAEAA